MGFVNLQVYFTAHRAHQMHVQCNDMVMRPNLHFVQYSPELLNYHYSTSGIFPRTFIHKEIVCHLVDYTFLLDSPIFLANRRA